MTDSNEVLARIVEHLQTIAHLLAPIMNFERGVGFSLEPASTDKGTLS